MILQPTDSQWAAASAVDEHVLVTAGAGAGKTQTVVYRILYLLGVELRGQRIARPHRLHDIAAITFTNQAAADLKQKVRNALRAAGLRRAAYEVDFARIGTIHAFCGELLREFALRAGRAPIRELLEEGAGIALAAEAVREALLDAIEQDDVPGIGDLLTVWSVSEVEQWMLQLVDEADRLHAIRGRQDLTDTERTVVELSARALARIEQQLEARGAVDFDRMIVWTRDLLRDDEGIRRALQRRIRTLIVDEFQDVDPVQKEIAFLLAEPASGRTDTTRLMLVGDPKQSIYRFRRADVTVWRSVEREFTEHGTGRVLALDESFRSVAPVLGFVDATIGQLLDRPLNGEAHQDFEVPYQAVRAKRSDGPSDLAVEIVVVPPDGEGKLRRVDDVRAIEAEAVAKRAAELAAEGVRAGEMAVLLPAWGALELYQAALERAGLRTYALRAEGFYERREVVDMILALEALRDPRDDRALLGFLRSPFVGVSDETLLAIARGARRPYWDGLGAVEVDDDVERSLLARGRELVAYYSALRDRVPAADLLASLLEESGYLAHLALLGEDGGQALANVRKFLRELRARRHTSVGELLRTIREVRARGEPVGDERLHAPDDDVVTLTTIHSAKGLEWRVVFWCDLVRGRWDLHGERFLLGRDELRIGDPDLRGEEQAPEWQALRERMRQEDEAEKRRLWYVAGTRAKDRLVLASVPLGNGRRGSDSAASALLELLPSIAYCVQNGSDELEYSAADGVVYRARVVVADPAAVPVEAESAEPKPIEDPAWLAWPLAPVRVAPGRPRHSATEFLTFSRCPRRHWFKYIRGVREPAVDRSTPEFMSAVTRGQIVHDVLEHLREEEELDKLLEDAVGRWAPDAPPPEHPTGAELRRQIRAEVQAVAGHPDYRAVADLPDARRELSFLYLHSDGAYAEGKIDLAAWRRGEGLVLVDVKTGCGGGASDVEARAAAYAPQRDVYVAAADAVSPERVTRFGFQFSEPAVQVSGVIGEAEQEAARRAFGEMLGRIRAGSAAEMPEKTAYPAECRWCGYRREGWCEGVGEISRGTDRAHR